MGDLRRLSNFKRGLTAGVFLNVMIERYGFPAAYIAAVDPDQARRGQKSL